jgi:uncharacterized membrane protein YhaH (DUF805 family)
MLNDYKLFWKNYANFNGRTPRRGYWFVYLINALIPLALVLIWLLLTVIFGGDSITSWDGLLIVAFIFAGLYGLYSLATLIPTLSLSIRRLHDTGRTWPWIFVTYLPTGVALILFIIVLVQSASTSNFTIAIINIVDKYLFISIIEGILNFICTIVWIILMASPTSPNAIGTSTHGGAAGASAPHGSRNQSGAGQTAGLGNAAAGKGTASIVGVKGMYAGYTFPVPAGDEIVIGRDSALSHVVIDRGAEKVSRKHLSVRYEPSTKMYQVYDFSTNGTFREDGVRLLTNTINTLPRNTILNLGSAQNSIRLS